MNVSTATSALFVEPEILIDVRAAPWGNAGFDAVGLCRVAAIEAVATAQEASGDIESLERMEISVVLADDGFVRELNGAWRDIDAPTNVLAFPCSEWGSDTHAADEDTAVGGAQRLLGDVVVAFQTTRREADDLRIPLDHHFAHLIIHGVLHLLGYDHMDDGDAAIMEKLEVKALARLGIGNPYDDERRARQS